MIEKNYIVSGRNTIIHKIKKFDLLIINGDNPVIVITHKGIKLYKGPMPEKKNDAKRAYLEVIDVSAIDVFGEEKTLIFIQSLDNKEYKVDYSKIGEPSFIKIHQEGYM